METVRAGVSLDYPKLEKYKKRVLSSYKHGSNFLSGKQMK